MNGDLCSVLPITVDALMGTLRLSRQQLGLTGKAKAAAPMLHIDQKVFRHFQAHDMEILF